MHTTKSLTTGLLLVTLAAIMVATASAKMNTQFIGSWEGFPTNSVLGPWAPPADAPLSFHIAPLDNTGNRWLMYDVFVGTYAPTSAQQFWVDTADDGKNGTLRYCGLLYNFYGSQPGVVTVLFDLVEMTETKLQWTMGGIWPSKWTLTLLNSTHLHSKIAMGEPAKHLDVVYKRVSNDPMPQLPADVQATIRTAQSAIVGGNPFPAPCNLTFGDHEGDKLHRARALSVQSEIAASDATTHKTKLRSLCPHGHTSGPMPEFVREALKMKKNNAAAAKSQDSPYKYCYRINTFANVTVRWNWNTSTQAVDVEFSMTLPSSAGMTPSNSYIALGIQPNWPAMQGMDVILGYFATSNSQGCVRSMYAADYVGTPTSVTNQTISNTGLRSDGNTLYMTFTRPWNTGFHDLNAPLDPYTFGQLSWAAGSAAATCKDDPGYHGDLRGTYGFSWSDPNTYMFAKMKC